MNPASDDIPLLTEVVSVGRVAAQRPAETDDEAGASLACLGEQIEALIDSTLSAAAATLRNELAARIAAFQRTLPAIPGPSAGPAVPIDEARARLRAEIAGRLAELTGAAPVAGSMEPPAPGDGAAKPAPEGMEKTYSPASIEQRWYQRWEEGGYFAPQASGPRYCILLPPPNVTGSLHMGHAFQDTLMDCLIRYRRMRGDSTLWQCGTDHAGIATQMVVERQLAERGERREQLGREAFVAAVWQWKAQSGGTISRQLRRMGSAMDWSRECFTLDPGPSRAVTEVFVRLYHEGLIYRGQRLVNWDPVLRTAISDLEVVAGEERGQLWEIRYPLDDGEGHVAVATTRPETMLGDSAVAVHPEDERYRHLIGRRVQLPLTGRSIPIIADDYVDREFGTGCLKITPAHDFDDYEVGARHGLPTINIFTPEARINDQAPAAYRGMDRFEARQQVVRDLEGLGLLASVREHTLTVPRGDRSNAILEPYLTDQWYVRIAPLAAPAIRAVAEGRIRFVPEGWSKTYFEWMRNIKDWCISRQLWWGHRIPAWYDAEGNTYVGRDEQEARKLYRLDPGLALTQDADVLDTWFSSALWPLSTLGWPQETPALKTFYPTSVLVTGFDIISFWVARMIMMGLKFTGEVPFREVYIHGLVRDADGQKMSKSKGNILDPLDLIDGIDLEALVAKRTAGLMQPDLAPRVEKATRRQFPLGIQGYGADALRYTFAALATQGRDIRFDLGRIEGYRNFCNKLWNATRYVLMASAERPVDTEPEYGLGERWIRARLQQAIRDVAQALAEYRFDLAAQALYEMIRDEYCDWYIEWSKVVLTKTGHPGLKAGAQKTLLEVLEQLLRLAHPFIPFITEDLWQGVAPRLGLQTESIMLAAYPEVEETALDAQSEETFAWVKGFALAVRRIRAEWDIAPSVRLKVFYTHGLDHEQRWLDRHTETLCGLLRIDTIERLEGEPAPDMSTALAGHMTVLVPLAGLIDREAEIKRLEAELDKLAAERRRCEGKLANGGFMARAPAEVVAKEQGHCEDISHAIARLGEQRARLEAMAGGVPSGAAPGPAEFTGER